MLDVEDVLLDPCSCALRLLELQCDQMGPCLTPREIKTEYSAGYQYARGDEDDQRRIFGKESPARSPHEEEYPFISRGAVTNIIRPARLVQFAPPRSASLFDHLVGNCKQ